MKTTTIQKWGNSYAVRIPKEAAEKLHLSVGQAVTISAGKDGKTLSMAPAKRELTLKEMVATISPKNRHGETDWGAPVGKEVW